MTPPPRHQAAVRASAATAVTRSPQQVPAAGQREDPCDGLDLHPVDRRGDRVGVQAGEPAQVLWN